LALNKLLKITQQLCDGSIVVHGTGISCCGKGVLLIGSPGSGKSDLALRMLALGSQLIADDQVVIHQDMTMRAPDNINGMIEVYGVGIIKNNRITTNTSGDGDALLPKLDFIIESTDLGVIVLKLDFFWKTTAEKIWYVCQNY
jgi:ABC-type dipeptide/oligopeptide/nickel transport system ATPase component